MPDIALLYSAIIVINEVVFTNFLVCEIVSQQG